MENNIVKFTSSKAPYGWMGNMAGYMDKKPLTITYEGKLWKTTENLFQAMRFEDVGIQGLIRNENGFNGKKVAKKFSDDMTVKPLSRQDILNMVKCIRLKIEQHPEVKKELIGTGTATIIEDVTYRPDGSGMFWGSAKINQHWLGHNILGVIWMYLRDDICFQKNEYGDEDEELLNCIYSKFAHTDCSPNAVCLKNIEDPYHNSEFYLFEKGKNYFVEKADNIYYATNDYGTIFTIGDDNTFEDDKFGNNFKMLD